MWRLRMKVLMVSNIYTHPHNMGNRQRIYRECCQMKELGWEIDFLYWGEKRAGNIDEMREFFGEEHFYHVNAVNVAPIYQLKNKVRTLWNKKGISRYIPLYYNSEELYSDDVEYKVQSLLDKKKYDAIWMQYLYQSGILRNIEPSVYKIIDTHDIFAHRNRIYQKKGRIPEGFYVTRRQEKRALSRSDLTVAIQENEEVYFRNLLNHSSTQCITLGDMVEFHKGKVTDNKVFGFIGAENDANVLGIEWLIKNILPIVLEKEPDSRCIIAGGICDLIKDSPYYKKMGRVGNLQEYYEQISFSINPIQNGTGLNIKGIEALSYGKPLVSTQVGAKGLLNAESAMIVCKGAEEFIDAIVLLLKDRERRQSMSQAAERFIYKYNEKNQAILKQIERMTNEKQGKAVNI